MSFIISAACASHPGHIRLHNEDNFLFHGECLPPENNGTGGVLTLEQDTQIPVYFAVFDGMGGENYGELASYAAASAARDSAFSPDDPYSGMESVALALNEAVVVKAREMLTNSMGTTMVSLLFQQDSLILCNVGDSRAFQLRKGKLIQISQDHVENLLPSHAALHRKPSLSQYLGVDPEEFQIEPYLLLDTLCPDDRYLLCSDGLTDMVPFEEIQTVLQEAPAPEACVTQLLTKALTGGGKDNITIIVCQAYTV